MRTSLSRVLLASSGWLLVLACGSRTGLPKGRELGAAGSENIAGGPVQVECVSAVDCPQPPPDQCGAAACTDGVCSLQLAPKCDDGNPCTVDMCVNGACTASDGRVDADGDGVFASGTTADPKAALGCGNDCDDAAANVHPQALELCDGVDNDCNGIVDDGTTLTVSQTPPTRVSPLGATRSEAAGLAFDGTSFGASMTTTKERSFGQFQQLDARGKLIDGPQQVARVNAQNYGGPLVWTGERYLTAYEDARQDRNYEIYFDLLNRKGQRIIQDLRVTNADDYSLRPSVLWTGAEALLIWDDRRFAGSDDLSALFGQRVSLEGQLLGANVRLSPAGVSAENVSVAMSDTELGMAFIAPDAQGAPGVSFMTVSRALDKPSALTKIDFVDANAPVVTALGSQYVVTFHQHGNTSIGPSIFGAVIDKNRVVRGPQSMTAGAAHARGNATYSYGDRFVMVWSDDRDGVYQLYAQTFDSKLSPISPRQRVTNSMTIAGGAVIAPAADGGLGILYTDKANGEDQTFFTRLDCGPGQLK
jgi:hypothetical protein